MRPRTVATTMSILILLAAVPVAVADDFDDGFYYEARTTVTPEGKKPTVTGVHSWVRGDKARMEFFEGPKKGLFARGNYLITEDGGRTMKLVDSKEETWSEIDLAAMMNLASTMLAGTSDAGMVTFENAYAEKLLDEPGGTLHGHTTTHKQWKSGMTMKTNVMGIKSTRHVEVLQDFWFTDEIVDRGFQAWLQPSNLSTGNEELDEMLRADFAQQDGFPMRSVSVTTSTTKKGKQSRSTSETVVTLLRKEGVQDERFTVPAHFEHRPIVLTEEQLRAAQGADADAGQADQPVADGGEQDGAFKGAKKKLTGLFKKKDKKKDD